MKIIECARMTNSSFCDNESEYDLCANTIAVKQELVPQVRFVKIQPPKPKTELNPDDQRGPANTSRS